MHLNYLNATARNTPVDGHCVIRAHYARWGTVRGVPHSVVCPLSCARCARCVLAFDGVDRLYSRRGMAALSASTLYGRHAVGP